MKIVEGIGAAQSNARRLAADAKLLLDARSFPSAAALAILAIEESGKVSILRRLALVSDLTEIKAVWRQYRNHRAKNVGWIMFDLVRGGARTLRGVSAAVDPEAEHTGVLEAVKQISLYSDCLGIGNWSLPIQVVEESLARAIVMIAEFMSRPNEITLREIELWRDIVAPHYNRASMVQAAIEWQRAMVAEGLSDTTPESLEAFLRGRPVSLPDAGQIP